MTKNRNLLTFGSLGACAMLVALMQNVGATDSDVVLNLEGNYTCSSLGPNKDIIEVRDTDPPGSGQTSMLMGPDGQEVTYTVADYSKGIAEWSSSVPVNYVILKGRYGSRVFHFGSGGVSTDTDEESRGHLKAVSFCYGLDGDNGGGGTTPPGLSELPNCEDIDDLDGAEIMCPSGSSESRVLISLDPHQPNFGLSDFKFCTCGATGDEWLACDEDAELGEENACPNGGGVERVPVDILGVEDPDSFFCYTVGGRRTCFYHAF